MFYNYRNTKRHPLDFGFIMQKLRGSPHIIVLLFYFLCLWSRTTGVPCPVRCACNDVTLIVVCDSANLDIVPITLNPELRELHLSNNHITGIGSSFRFYHSLEYLDISSNNLVSLNNDNFSLPNLKYLFLNQNNISELQNKTFIGLNLLETLYLNENSLENLSGNIFIHLQNLEILELSQNKISFIDQKAFFGLKNLKTLSLRGNQLSTIPSSSFQYLSKLYNLDMGLNFFKSIPESSFAFLNDLNELSLDSCGIEVIIQGAFKWLNSLHVLHIHNNELSEIPTKAFFDVVNLQELHIGQNKFFDIKGKPFQRLKFLHTIDISGCPYLEFIGKNVFSDNISLKTVIMNDNKVLRHIQDGAFHNLPDIKYVSLRANDFETFQLSLLPWEDLYYLDVRDNPLVCNCSLLWLWKLLVTKNYSSPDGLSDTTQVVCAHPLELKDTILPNLQESDLDCYTIDTRRQIIIGIVLAGAVASAAIIMVGFSYRDKVAGVLKTKWGRSRKEPQYQKTCAEEENTILQTAHQSLKMTPVTEL